MLFSDLNLKEETLRAIFEAGYKTPTLIQQQVIPYVLKRQNIFGCAQTGTGKTASYTLPLLDILASGRARARMPRLLIMVPTRELAHQVAESFEKYGKYYKNKIVLTIGGESIYEQERKLAHGADILIATPGRLLDLFERSKIILHALETVVIDEADRMLDMGFIPDIEKIFSFLPAGRQTLMFSATVSSEIRKLSESFLKNFEEITVSDSQKTAVTIQHYIVKTYVKEKRQTLRYIIQSQQIKNAIIFCNRKKDIETLCQSLKRHGYNAAPLHGDLNNNIRTETLSAFKKGQINFLIASDVAGRGIDIEDLDFVINFDVPTLSEEYVHRIGRTGRAGRAGQAFMLVTREEMNSVRSIQKLLKFEIPNFPIDFDKINEVEQAQAASKVNKKVLIKEQSKKVNTSSSPKHNKIFSNHPILGFGDNVPAFMQNYFPDLKAIIVVPKPTSLMD